MGSLMVSLLERSTLVDSSSVPGHEALDLTDDRGLRFRMLSSSRDTTLFLELPTGRVPILPGLADGPYTTDPRRHAVLSPDGRFVALFDDATARVWRGTGAALTGDFPHPSLILDARFITRGNTTFLQTICADGAVREWFVFEDFRDKPEWAIELAALNHGRVLGDDGAEKVAPGYMVGDARAALFAKLRATDSPAAKAVLRHFTSGSPAPSAPAHKEP
jgi:hypothetical protein